MGKITLGSDGFNLIGLWVEGDRYFGETLSDVKKEDGGMPIFQQTRKWLDIYFAGEEPSFCPPLLVRGSDFRRQVCKILLTIPYGEIRTYGDIAREIAEKRGVKKMSAQAVGGAVGHNPVPIIIPCHRVVGADGSLTGYGGGLERKWKLLTLEGADTSRLYIPEESRKK